MHLIGNILFYTLFLLFTLVYFVFFCLVYLLTVPFDKRRAVLHWASRVWTRCYFGSVYGWKIKLEGAELIDRRKTYVVIVNHRSMLDILLMYVLPLNFKWVAKKEVYKWPLFGWVMRMHGDIAIERGTAGAVRKMIKDGKRWMDRGVSVIVFPEGSRSKTDTINKFREGAFAMAQTDGVGILPCVTYGTGSAMTGWKVNLHNVFSVRVLQPISAEETAATDVRELTSRIQRLVTEEYEKMKNEI